MITGKLTQGKLCQRLPLGGILYEMCSFFPRVQMFLALKVVISSSCQIVFNM